MVTIMDYERSRDGKPMAMLVYPDRTYETAFHEDFRTRADGSIFLP